MGVFLACMVRSLLYHRKSAAVMALGMMHLSAASPVAAAATDDLRFCPNRPSLGSSACTIDQEHVMVEQSFVDWERDDADGVRQDTFLFADTEARIGVGPTTEVQVSLTTLGTQRTRDVIGTKASQRRVGDVRLGVRQNFRNPDGSGFSYGIEPFVTLPVGRRPIGAGTWGAGAVLPVTYDLTDSLNLAFTGTAEAAPNGDGHGRHLAYDGIIGLSCEVIDALTVTGELQLARDNDPDGHVGQAIAAGSIAWQPRKHLQLDFLVGAGLNRDTPDLRVVAGGAILF